MNFPDRPIVTAGLGIACALVLLAILSYPAMVNAPSSTIAQVDTTGEPSGQYLSNTASASMSITSTITVASTVASTTTESASGNALPQSSSALPASSSTTLAESSITTVAQTTVTETASATTQAPPAAATNTGGNTTSFVAGNESGITSVESSVTQPALSVNTGTSAKTGVNYLGTIAELSIASLVIALATMFFVSRRVSSREDSTE